MKKYNFSVLLNYCFFKCILQEKLKKILIFGILTANVRQPTLCAGKLKLNLLIQTCVDLLLVVE